MNLRATLALLVIAAGIGAYVFWVEIGGEEERAAAERAEKRLLDLDPDAVTALELPLEGGGIARVVAAGASGWRLETPLEFPADAERVKSLLGTLEALESKAVFDDRPEALEPFGLGEASQSVRVWSGAQEPLVVRFGKETPLGGQVYAALEGDEAAFYTVEKFRASQLRPQLDDLRDGRLTKLEPAEVTGFRVRAADRLVVRAERVAAEESSEEAAPSGEWWLSEPLEDRGDAARIRRLLQDLSLARATGFVDAPGALSQYGLARPELEITLEAEGRTETLALGRADGKGYGRVGGAGVIYETRERLLDETPREAFAYRDKHVLSLDSDQVRGLELVFPRDGESYRFEREEASWTPIDAEIEVDGTKPEVLVFTLSDLEATGIEEQAGDRAALGLDPPRVRAVLRDEAGEELAWVELGDPTPGKGIAAFASSGARVWRVINDLGEVVPLGAEAFRSRWLKEAQDAEADAEESGEDLE